MFLQTNQFSTTIQSNHSFYHQHILISVKNFVIGMTLLFGDSFDLN